MRIKHIKINKQRWFLVVGITKTKTSKKNQYKISVCSHVVLNAYK